MIPTLALASVGSYSNLEHPPPTLPAASSFQPWMSLPPTNVPISDVPSSDVPIFSEVSIINCLGQRIASANCQVPWHKLSTASANEMPRHKSSSASAQIILCTRLPSKKGSRFNIRPRKGARGLIIHNSSCGATRGQRGSRSARRTIENIRGIDAFICTHNINADAYTLLYTSASANMLPTFAVHGVCMGKLNRRTVVCLGTTSIQPSCASAHDPPSCASAQHQFNCHVPWHMIHCCVPQHKIDSTVVCLGTRSTAVPRHKSRVPRNTAGGPSHQSSFASPMDIEFGCRACSGFCSPYVLTRLGGLSLALHSRQATPDGADRPQDSTVN